MPKTPYFAVIFRSVRTAVDDGYGETANRMEELAKNQQGFLGIESFSNDNGRRVTISYWQTEADIVRWKACAEHLLAQQLGKERWYSEYQLEVCRVERAYEMLPV